jgi:hypothetical protein
MEIVNVPVPVDRLQEVYEVLGRPRVSAVAMPQGVSDGLSGGSRGAQETQLPLGPSDNGGEAWDQDDIRELWQGSEGAAKAVLGYLADRPNEDVPLDALLEVLKQDGRAFGGVLGALQRRSRNRFEREMPILKRRRRGTNHYVLPEDVARWVRDIRTAEEGVLKSRRSSAVRGRGDPAAGSNPVSPD